VVARKRHERAPNALREKCSGRGTRLCESKHLLELSVYQLNYHGLIGKEVDDVEAPVVLFKGKDLCQIHIEEMAQNYPVYTLVPQNEDIFPVIGLQDRVNTLDYSLRKIENGFTFGYLVGEGLGHSLLKFSRELLFELLEGQTFPNSEVEFPQFGKLQYLDVVVSCYYLSPEEGALKIT